MKTFVKNIDTIYSKSSEDPLQNIIEEEGVNFIKPMICSLVRYMCQNSW